MNLQTTKASKALSQNPPPQEDHPEDIESTYELASTLGGYEIEEIDVHDLARFLPTLALDDDSQDEGEPMLNP